MAVARVGTLNSATAVSEGAGWWGRRTAGVVSGLLGGGLMAIYLVAAAAIAGMPWFRPFRVIGATFVGREALGQGLAVLFGVALHALASGLAGLVFAAMARRDLPPLCAAVAGTGYALMVMALMASLVVPAVNPVFRREMQPIGGSWVIAHALFGAVLGLCYVLVGRPPRGGATGS